MQVGTRPGWTKSRTLAFAKACLIFGRGCQGIAVREKILEEEEEEKKLAAAPQHENYLEVAAFHLISEWYHGAILQLSETKGFQSDVSWIAKRLGISEKCVALAIDRLLSLGLLTKNNGKLVRVSGDIKVPEVPSYAIQNFHSEMAIKSSQIVFTEAPANRDFTGAFISVDKQRISEIRDKILANAPIFAEQHRTVIAEPKVVWFNAYGFQIFLPLT